ncbi:MAG: PorP/SprF family type IX secretion system membrane protein [Phaeodactylibacter sp.]|nr:PorP/SprF family type IX secretion system membrane protein [Phaeodactylibacter sp.]
MRTIRPIFLLLGLCLGLASLHAQDIHFSQWYRSPQNLNPALSGVFKGDYRFSGIFRSQWSSIPVPYQTFTANLDMKLPVRLGKNGFLAAGGLMNVDKAGDSEMRAIEVGASGSAGYFLTDGFAVSVGASVGYLNRQFNFDQLTFNEQFDGEIFNASNPTGETDLNNTQNQLRIGGGLNAHLRIKDRRTQVNLGAGFHNINQPDVRFGPTPAVLSMRNSYYLQGAVEILPMLDIAFGQVYQTQGPYQENVSGGTIRYYLNPTKTNELMLGLGTYARWGDALIPTLEVRYQGWEAALTYDINTSDLQAATNRRGGPEISLTYILARVEPPPVFKACPIF